MFGWELPVCVTKHSWVRRFVRTMRLERKALICYILVWRIPMLSITRESLQLRGNALYSIQGFDACAKLIIFYPGWKAVVCSKLVSRDWLYQTGVLWLRFFCISFTQDFQSWLWLRTRRWWCLGVPIRCPWTVSCLNLEVIVIYWLEVTSRKICWLICTSCNFFQPLIVWIFSNVSCVCVCIVHLATTVRMKGPHSPFLSVDWEVRGSGVQVWRQ